MGRQPRGGGGESATPAIQGPLPQPPRHAIWGPGMASDLHNQCNSIHLDRFSIDLAFLIGRIRPLKF